MKRPAEFFEVRLGGRLADELRERAKAAGIKVEELLASLIKAQHGFDVVHRNGGGATKEQA